MQGASAAAIKEGTLLSLCAKSFRCAITHPGKVCECMRYEVSNTNEPGAELPRRLVCYTNSSSLTTTPA